MGSFIAQNISNEKKFYHNLLKNSKEYTFLFFIKLAFLRINLDKSENFPVGRVENLEAFALEFSCKVGRLPTTYLGFPLGEQHKSMAVWDRVEERFQKRLAM